MILKGNQRGGAMKLADHLFKGPENEHIELHEMRGFMADTPSGAFKEMDTISKGTRCSQFMFSLSLNPPQNENVPLEVFEQAISRAEARLGLTGQPRLIVFHEKEGRRHAHCVWSRIDPKTMTAVNLPHYKLKLSSLSKQLYVEHGWKMPKGFVHQSQRDPTNFSLAEWQQAKRLEDDPKALKELFKKCWAVSDSAKAFGKALEDRGFYLAQGDKRGFVAVDYRGEVYSLSRWAGLKTKELKDKLGDPKDLPSVEKTKADIAKPMTKILENHIRKVDQDRKDQSAPLLQERRSMAKRHGTERRKMEEEQEIRRQEEFKKREGRLPHGLRRVWYTLTGKLRRIRTLNELETKRALIRDRKQKQDLVEKQLGERRWLQKKLVDLRKRHTKDRDSLRQMVAQYVRLGKTRSLLDKDFEIPKKPPKTHERSAVQPIIFEQGR